VVPMSSEGESRQERGQLLPLVALVVVAAGVACLVVARLGAAATARARAATAADAAALAGVADGAAAARRLAERNGSRLVAFQREGDDAAVTVEVGRAQARARARRGGPAEGAPGPGLRAALARAAQLLGQPVPLAPPPAGGGPRPAAPRRQAGLAVDVAPEFVDRLAAVARQAGLCQPFPRALPGHFELCAAVPGVP